MSFCRSSPNYTLLKYRCPIKISNQNRPTCLIWDCVFHYWFESEIWEIRNWWFVIQGGLPEGTWSQEAYLLFPVHLDGTVLDHLTEMQSTKTFFPTITVLHIFQQVSCIFHVSGSGFQAYLWACVPTFIHIVVGGTSYTTIEFYNVMPTL